MKTALAQCMEYYNNKWHGTIKCTPEEAFQQKFISTNDLKNMQPEDLRTRIVEATKRKGQIANQGHIMEFKIGDKILVRDRIKTKVRHDGQKLLIPMMQTTNRYSLKAKITKLKGNCFDIQFE